MVRSPTDRVTTQQALPALLRQNFDLFLAFAFRELTGNRQFVREWYLDAIERQLHRLDAGDTRQLIVTLPPRHLKSIMITVAWVAWKLGREPQTRFTCASYAYDLAEKHARDCLKIMESSWYRLAFPNMRLTKRSLLDFETYAGGGRLSTSIGGVLTGRGGDWIIIDDPMKADDALSEVQREAVKDWFANTVRQRADDDKTRYIIVMQRLHEDDLAGALLRKGGWHELKLPAIAPAPEIIPLTRERFHNRLEGDVLSPVRQSLAWLEQRRLEEPYVFAAQYQQDPIGRIGSFVDPRWFGVYDEQPRTGTVIQSWDTAVKTTVRSDWSVGITAILYQDRYYIIDVYRRRVEFGELLEAVRSSCDRFKVQRLLIEDAASGQQLIQQLRGPLSRVPPPVAISPTSDKVVRFEAQANRIKDGQVVLPRTAPWLPDFLTEIGSFPGGAHDDQADALAQLLANPPFVSSVPDNAGPELFDGTRWIGGDEDYQPRKPFDRTYGRLSWDDEADPWLTL